MFPWTLRAAAGVSVATCLCVLHPPLSEAFEPTGSATADAFLSLLEAEDGTVESYGSATEADGTTTISDLVLVNDGGASGKVIISKTSLSGGEVLDNGRLKLSALMMESLELTDEDGRVLLQDISATGLLLPSLEEAKADKSPLGPGYKTFEANQLQIFENDAKIADIAKVTSSIDGMDGDLPTGGSFSMTGATIDVEQLEAEETNALRGLGYTKLTLDIAGTASWNPDAATVVIPSLKIDAKDAAALSVSLSLGGVTREILTKLNENSDNPQEAMALAQNVTVDAATIRLDDASLTNRVLEQEAKKMGVETPTYVSSLTGSLPLMLGMLQNKELEAQVSQAVTTYLNAPGSLEVTAAPGAPVPIAQIFGTAMFSPQMIPQILSLAIKANQ